ncbi:hypothetical protein PG995_005008 [Apiospora arundinis]
MAGKRSEHHPEKPTWTASDLQDRWETLHGIFTNSATEAEAAGRDHFDFATEQYGRLLALLEDAGAAVDDVHQRRDMEDPKYSLEEMEQTEAAIVEFLNDALSDSFDQARIDAGGAKMFLPPFPKKDKEEKEEPSEADQKVAQNIANLRSLMTHLSWLQSTSTLQDYHRDSLEPHLQWMQSFIDETLPEPRRVWWQGDIMGNAEFEGLWAEFQSLETGALSTDANPDGEQQETNTDLDNRKLVENSQNILLDAFGALLLNPEETGVTWEDLQGRRDDVPSYLTHPPWTDAFWEGAGNDGAQFLMENLGYDRANGATQSHMRADQSMMSSTMVAMNRKIKYDCSNKGKEAKNSGNSSTTKRSAPSPEGEPILYGAGNSASIPASKKQKTHSAPPTAPEQEAEENDGEEKEDEDGDAETDEEEDDDEEEYYLLNDAVNDIRNMRAQIGLEPALPAGTLLVTPVEPMQEAFVKNVRGTWTAFAGEYDAVARFIQQLLPSQLSETTGNADRAPLPPGAELAIESNLARLKKDLEREHATMATARAEPLNDTARLKQWRVTAWQIRYLRSLQLALMILSESDNDKEFGQAYDRRLEDWIEHEMAWIAHDNHSLHYLLTNQRAKDEARSRVRARQANIEEWDTILEEMGYPGQHIAFSAEVQEELRQLEAALRKKYEANRQNPDAETRAWAAREAQELEEQRKAWPQVQAAIAAEQQRKRANGEQFGPGSGARAMQAELGLDPDNHFNMADWKIDRSELEDEGMSAQQQEFENQRYLEVQKRYLAELEEQAAKEVDDEGNPIRRSIFDIGIAVTPPPPPTPLPPAAWIGRKQPKPKETTPSPHRITKEGRILGSLTYKTTGPAAHRPAADPNSATIFAAGGPPGFRGIPTDTVYEKLQYMIILTYWRCWMAAETGL